MDNAGLEEDSYENFAQIVNPGFNLPYARQIGSGLASLFTKNPMVGLITRGIGYLGDRTRLPGVVGGADVRVRARQIALEIANTGSSEDWKLGTFRLDIHPGGRR